MIKYTGKDNIYYGLDHQGTTVLVTDETGEAVWSAESTPFGDHVMGGIKIREDLRLKFTGKDLDPDSGLWYFNQRWYDSSTGRFITEDPIRSDQNWFSYVSNNPLKYVDPTGMYIVKSTNQYSYYMQTYSGVEYGHYSEKLADSGCAITMMAKAMSALNDKLITPKKIAEEINNFKGGDIDWGATASRYELTAKKYSTNDYSYEDIKNMIERTASSAKGFAYGVEIELGSGSHYVNSTGTRMIGGKEYVEIDPTSINDVEYAGKGSRTGWRRLNGKLYVPIEKVKSVIVVSNDKDALPEEPDTPDSEKGGSDPDRDPYRNGMNDEPNEDPEVKRDGHGNPSGL